MAENNREDSSTPIPASKKLAESLSEMLADIASQVKIFGGVKPRDVVSTWTQPPGIHSAAQQASSISPTIRAAIPQPDFSQFGSPPLKFNYSSLLAPTVAIRNEFASQLSSHFSDIINFQREQLSRSFAGIAQLVESWLPPNWKGVPAPSKELLQAILLDEGLPLAWVPPAPILRRLFAAPTPQRRREVIGRAWQPIIRAAASELDEIKLSRLRQDVHFAHQVVAALQSRNYEAGQALASNLLDTLLRKEFDRSDRVLITGQKDRFKIDDYDYPLPVALVLGGIWGCHSEFRGGQGGGPIPNRYSRHASVHAVSRKQYSRVNAVISLMHVTALLRMIERDLPV